MYVLILPGFVFFVVFAYVPLIGNDAAWQDYSPYLGFRASPWVGWQNFLNIFSDPELIRATQNTLLLGFLQLVFAFPAPLALALLLKSVLSERTRRTIQAIAYLPHFIGWVIVVSIWNEILGPLGVVNHLLDSAGLGHADIIGNPGAFASLVTAQVIWKEVGWGTIIFLAAMLAIPGELYESAAMDRAGPTAGIDSATSFSKGDALAALVQDYVNGIVTGRKPVSDVAELRKRWKANGGDQVREELQAGIAEAEKAETATPDTA